ncbi:hypothetical protein ACFX15_041507 [Malus domestica]
MQRTNNNGTAGSTQPACAACKHQRKKCHAGCILAPYFPADRTREFLAVHKVFGVSNVTKMVKNVEEPNRRKVAESLVWEALCRQKDPVLGAYGEYRMVSDELKRYKQQQNRENHIVPLQMQKGLCFNKSLSDLVGNWNGGITNVNNSGYLRDNDDVIPDSAPFGYPLNCEQQSHEKVVKQVKMIDSVVVPLHQQHQQQQHYSVNNINQQYYLTGQFNEIIGKRIEGTIWEGGS